MLGDDGGGFLAEFLCSLTSLWRRLRSAVSLLLHYAGAAFKRISGMVSYQGAAVRGISVWRPGWAAGHEEPE
jgi:hypothetical protein